MKTKSLNVDWSEVDREIDRHAALECVLHRDKPRRKRVRTVWEIIAFVLAIVLLYLALGCAGRGAYTTLASTEKAVVLSYDGYVDSVIKGQTRTNELPVIAKSFDMFQAAFRTAVDAASGNTNAPVTGDLSTKAANLIQQITTAKSQPK